MGFKKEIIIEKLEVVGDFKKVGIKEATVVYEGSDSDGWAELSRSVHRKVITPDADVSSESSEVKDMCNLVWTDGIKASWDTYVASIANEGL
jgi:hypothetical protein|tara:strand:+ start:43278 stop:43553 length:276 start_codon:yes stop_codon:yes gene_type:complete